MKPPVLPQAPKDYDASYHDRTNRILTQYLSGQEDGTAAGTASDIANSAAKTTPVDADSFGFWDSVTQRLNQVTWANIKAAMKTYTDGLYQALSGKDASGGYVGLTLFKINFKNAANTFTSFFTNANTAARTYTFQDRDGTIADLTDIAGAGTGVLAYNRKNLVINGAFDIAQRNTTYALTTTFAYGCVDRWGFHQATTAACTASQAAVATSGVPFRYALKLQRTAAATTTGVISATTAFETTDSVKYAGKQVTLSFWAKAGANYSASGGVLTLALITGTGTDQANAADPTGSWTGAATPVSVAQAVTTTWTRYSVTGTIATSATQIALRAYWTPVGTAGADDSVYITGVQIEVGAAVTDFEFRPLSLELALCQRYYAAIGTYGLYLGIPAGSGNNSRWSCISLPVTMRTAPTLVITADAGVGGSCQDARVVVLSVDAGNTTSVKLFTSLTAAAEL